MASSVQPTDSEIGEGFAPDSLSCNPGSDVLYLTPIRGKSNKKDHGPAATADFSALTGQHLKGSIQEGLASDWISSGKEFRDGHVKPQDPERACGSISESNIIATDILGTQVESEQPELSAAEQKHIDQVLALSSTEKAADKLLVGEGLINPVGMRPSRNDPDMQARLLKMARKGHSGESANAPHPVRAGGSPHMSVARSQVTSATVALAQGAQKRKAEEPLPREAGRRRLEEEPRRDLGKRPVSSTTLEAEKRASRDPVTGHLEPWVDAEMVIGSYKEAVRQMLRVDVVEGLFTEEMGYSGMTLSALEDQMKATLKLFVATQNVAAHREFDRGQRDEQAVTVAKLNRTIGEKAKVEEELGLVWGRLEAEMKKNAELLSLVNLVKSQRELDESKSQRELDEAKQKIEALSFKLQSCYDDAVKDYIKSAEYQEKLDSQRVEGYFDLIEKVGEKYPAINWSFLDNEAKEASVEVVKGGRGCPEF